MYSKVYNVTVLLDLLSVNCPGVWLCPKGTVFIKMTLFGVSDMSKQVGPTFPLVFNEQFRFEKVFKHVGSLVELHRELETSRISLELLQYPASETEPIKLAGFLSNLAEVLNSPQSGYKTKQSSADMDLLFSPSKVFPGIIAPKAEVSTKIAIVESVQKVGRGKSNVVPATVSSRSGMARTKKEKIIRQHPVCHSKNNFSCKCFRNECFRKVPEGGDSNRAKSKASSIISDNSIESYSSLKKKVIDDTDKSKLYHKIPILSEKELQDCQLCTKYELYFKEKSRSETNCRCLCAEVSSKESIHSNNKNEKIRRKRSETSIDSGTGQEEAVFYCHCHRYINRSDDEHEIEQESNFTPYFSRERTKEEKKKKKTALLEKNKDGTKWGLKTLP